MKKSTSIRTKLVSSIMILISVIFTLVLSVITTMNVINVNKNISKSKDMIWNALVAKGSILIQNNSMAMTGLADDNAFTAIQTLVSSTVKADADLSYGIYMNQENIPLVYVTLDNPDGGVKALEPLKDSISMWASTLSDVKYKTFKINGIEIVEFSAPVIFDHEKLGTIRYGLSTKKMNEMIAGTIVDGKNSRNQSIAILVLLCLISLVTGYIVIRGIAQKITSPIASLVNSSKVIADGNYNTAVIAESDDEIGNLADHFESMRSTIKRYTDHLQEIIDAKMQQVNDILNNIDQGLFTINLDGSVNEECSARANEILKVQNIASQNINELLRLDLKQMDAFNMWLNVVKTKHASIKWKKLVKLAPVQALELIQKNTGSPQYVAISYQKIFDKQGELSKIMILAMDETEKRMKDLQMLAERQMHEYDVKAILGIANTPSEEITELTNDIAVRMRELHEAVNTHLAGVKLQRENYPDGPDYIITKEQINTLYRNIHTIKGNAGSYGFELLSDIAHKAEDMIEELKEPIKMRRNDSLAIIEDDLKKMDAAFEEIHKKILLIFGKEDEITIRVPENRISKIQEICATLSSQDVTIKPLIDECMMLTSKPLKTLARKYLKIVQTVSKKQNKNVEFQVIDEMSLFSANELIDIDEALVHLIRNAVDHGIEAPDVREELNKGVGKIKFEYFKDDSFRIVTISDDGKGIDTEALVEKCVQKGIVTADVVPVMKEKDKFMLMFHPGISTSDTITDISGRGIGMNVVMENISQKGGTIEIESQMGKGTTFRLKFPIVLQTNECKLQD
jgi:signal transduction histidine kinase/HAMP domain-containing protein